MDLYEILGVSKNATQEEIKQAYRKKANETHPDVGGDAERFALVSHADSILSNPSDRRRYDQTGQNERTTPIESRAAAMVSCAFDAAMDNEFMVSFAYKDLVEKIHGKIEQISMQLSKRLEDEESQFKTMSGIRKRLKRKRRKPGEDILLGILDGKIRAHMGSIRSLKEEQNVCSLAHKLVDEYEYKTDPEPLERQGIRMGFTFGNLMAFDLGGSRVATS